MTQFSHLKYLASNLGTFHFQGINFFRQIWLPIIWQFKVRQLRKKKLVMQLGQEKNTSNFEVHNQCQVGQLKLSAINWSCCSEGATKRWTVRQSHERVLHVIENHLFLINRVSKQSIKDLIGYIWHKYDMFTGRTQYSHHLLRDDGNYNYS